MEIDEDIIIAGFSGTGKSHVAREVAQRLNWHFIDTDNEVSQLAGKSIAEIFQQDGEGKFRELERHIIEKACQQKQAVIALGGGAIVDPRNYKLLARSGAIICLEAEPETIYQRLFNEKAYGVEAEVRPLLSDENPLERIRELKASRQHYYDDADWTIHTDHLNINQVAGEVIRVWKLLGHRASHSHGAKAGSDIDEDIASWVETPIQSYPLFVGYGLLDKLGAKMKQAGLSGTAIVVSDENVFSFYGSRVEGILKDAGFAVNAFVVPPGETSKSMNAVITIYDFMVGHRVERNDIIVALGGGMVGDLAGFVAATFLRGISWVQVPTSLLAMVDASIGGKVGVNHPQGKNVIGAFYQPSLVLADCQTLTTLPQRELISGWAEVIKHGLILDRSFVEFLEANAERIRQERALLTQAVARSAAIKALVVNEDEKEKGKRILLNYGHTIAHGLEAATQYECFLHGEAVAIGMVGAARIAEKLGLLSSNVVQRQQVLLERFNLPVSFSHIDLSKVMKAMELDKKTREKTIQWVLLQDIGRTVIHNNVPQQIVSDVLQELMES